MTIVVYGTAMVRVAELEMGPFIDPINSKNLE